MRTKQHCKSTPTSGIRAILAFLAIVCIQLVAMGQGGRFNNWYFGNTAGVSFASGAPVALTNGVLSTTEGCASISTEAGNLLFYTDGVTVWNANHLPMTNGTGLTGHASSTQSAIIVQQPLNPNRYFIFTADADVGPNGIRYSVVDMSLSAGLGAVTTTKNVPLQTPSCEKICAVRHCNNRDVWIVSHDWNSNTFRTWLLTPTGLNTTPVLSNAGIVPSGIVQSGYGQLKANLDGNRLLACYYGFAGSGANRIEAYDFNNSTGVVSNAITLASDVGLYGCEFSPNGRMAYGATNPGTLIQFNLCAGNAAAIVASRFVVATTGPIIGSLQLGPDGRIYIARNSTFLSVINNPNTAGAGCGFVNGAIPLAGRTSRVGLPNMASFYLRPPTPPFTATANCLNVGFAAPSVSTSANSCAGASSAIQSVQWNFGDPASGAANTSTLLNPSHTFSAVGTYSVRLVLNLGCYNDTLIQSITLNGFNVSTSTTPASCGANNGTASVTPAVPGVYTYAWSNGQTTATATGLAAGNYSVTVTSLAGCSTVANVTVSSGGALTLNVNPQNATCFGSASGSAAASTTGGVAPYTYAWSNGGAGASVSGLSAGSYSVTVTDASGCSATQSFNIAQPTALNATVNVAPPTCSSVTGSASLSVSGGTAPYTYAWSSGSTAASVSGLANGSYSVVVNDNNGCSLTRNFSINIPPALTATLNATAISCSGAANGSASLSASGGTPPYTYAWSNGATTAAVGNLPPGAISVTLTDAAGCTITRNTTITQPSPLQLNLNVTQPSCSTPSGSISANVSGGTSPYTYSWSSGQSTAALSGLSAGSYTLAVSDANGCQVSQTGTLNLVNGITVSINSSNLTCFGAANGSATAVVSGGGAPYTYAWSSGQTTPIVNGLNAGVYTVTATNSNGCSASASTTLTQPGGISLSLSATEASCGAANGTAAVVASGGQLPYTYSWNTNPIQTTAGLSGLTAGTYQVTVSDANGCSVQGNAVVNSQNGPVLTTNVTQQIACFGATTGAIQASATGGSAPYQFSWSSGQTTANVSNLAAGAYTVTVTDATGCTASEVINLNAPTALAAVVTTTAISCNGGSDGTASIVVTGGTAPYSFAWSNGASGSVVSGLGSGAYTVNVSDWNGCTISRTISMIPPPLLVVSDSVVAVSCFGGNDGQAYLQVSGGIGPYTANWGNGQNGMGLSGLSAGLHTYSVVDAAGCTQSGSVVITQPTALSAGIQATPVSCFNASDANLDLTISGGTAPFTIVWNTGDATEDLLQQSAGTYTAAVSDAMGCTASSTVLITEPDSISFTWSVTPSSCSGSTGSLLFSASGGTAPYQYSLDGGAFQNNPFFGSLTAGQHVIEIRDASQCLLSRTVAVPSPNGITVGVVNIQSTSCFGLNNGSAQAQVTGGTPPFSVQWSSNESGLLAQALNSGLQFVTVTDAAGCSATQNFSVQSPAAITHTAQMSPATCYGLADASVQITAGGGTGSLQIVWESGATAFQLSGLTAGWYPFEITDANGCVLMDTVEVSQPAQPILILATASPGDCGASSGNISLQVSGGTAPYNYTWNEIAGLNSPVAGNLTPGTYTVQVTDQNNCQTSTSVTLNSAPPISVMVDSVRHASCFDAGDGGVYLSVSGGTAPYQYQWGQGLQPTIPANLPSGTYSMQVIDNAGCSTTANFTINQPLALVVTATPQHLTCNGAGNGRIFLSINGGTQPYSYQWSNGLQTQNNNNLAAGSYQCTITDANGCSVQVSQVLTEPAMLTLELVIDQPGCDGLPDGSIATVLTGGTTPYSFQWSNGSIAPAIAGLPPGEYVVNAIDANGCSRQATAMLSSTPAFDIFIEGDTVLCAGEQTILTASANGIHNQYIYEWQHGPLGANIGVNPMASGWYTVTVTDSTGCSGTRSVFVKVNPVPELAIVADDTSGCAPFCAKIYAVSPQATDWLWSFSNGLTANTEQALPCFDLPGIYSVQLVVQDSNGCKRSMTWEPVIEVFANPVAAFSASPYETTLDYPQVYFQNQSVDASTYSYHFGDPAQSMVFVPNAMHTYQDTGYFEVTLEVTNPNGCRDMAIQTVHIGGFTAFYIPKAFTPNDDGLNDTFMPKATGLSPNGFEMRIFDRWGNQIFYSDDWNKGWDGTYMGKPVPLDQYVCKVRYYDKIGNQNDHIGSVVVTE
jgi:gliding motility-associated-like protein